MQLGIFFWLIGFFRAGFRFLEGPPFLRSFIRLPFLIYLLCGLPRASNLPKGVISTGAVLSQFWGILYVTYGIVSNRLTEENIFIHAFAVTILIIGIFCFAGCSIKSTNFLLQTQK
ncbi:MAG: hypothetical protein IPP55_17985 [Anaerolineales bacterium]|nr:hypothetical protein [Anaerolineales bacterium]